MIARDGRAAHVADHRIAGMGPSLRTLVRTAAAMSVVAAASLAAAVPASAEGMSEGEPSTSPMSVGTALLVFGLIPLGFIGLIWLLVVAPGWTRGGRAGAVDGWTADPLVVDGASAAALTTDGEATAALEAGSAESPGGTSARW